jgi:RNase H-like domain found in reverse transcriptase/Reverse transcriptase (RNA-dependent DNA polymerase)/Integrase zinc binding domain/Chromo (CHRromatin Organisation MOdifier) domain
MGSRQSGSSPALVLRANYIEEPALDVPSPPFPDPLEGVPTDPEFHARVPSDYHDYADVFSEAKSNRMPPHRASDHRIDLDEGTQPPLGRMYSLSVAEQEALKIFLDDHVKKGWIRPSGSAAGAPILFIRKKDGALRLCVDYRGLNRITKKDRYPLPLISDLLDRAGRAKIYTKIDLRIGYFNVRINAGDEWKTTFRTRHGAFEFMVMPLGLCNAPSTFQRFMNEIFADLTDVYVVIYLDDILVYSDNEADHKGHVREVLRRLRANSLFGKLSKCSFHQDTVEYLGFTLSPAGLAMDPAKVRTIVDWPEPRKVRDIQSFLGFGNFYRRFIPNYSGIVAPLTRLTRKAIVWNFDTACRTAFTSLKEAFTAAPVLMNFNPGAPLIVETDASDYAVAGILSSTIEDGSVHPIAYYSRTMSPTELNYDTHDKELLAINEAFKTWRHYLEGTATPVDVVTDHKNLEYFATTKMLSRRQARWSEFLSSFNMVIRFRPGRLGAKPDALTRRFDVYPKEGDSDYARVNPQNFRPVFTTEQLASSLRASTLAAPILRAAALIDVEALHTEILAALEHDPITKAKMDSIKVTPEPRWKIDNAGFLRLDNRIFVPSADNLRLQVLRNTHDHPTAGHLGQNKTLAIIRREYTWPEIRKYVREYCQSCTVCARSKVPRHRPYGTLKQLPIPEKPWNSVSMDFIEQLPSSDGFTSILVVVDRLTKQAIFIPTHDTITSPQLAQLFIIHVFSKHGVPSNVTCDRGSKFVSHFFRSLGTALDMKLRFTSGYHPEANGQTERVNQTLEQYLRVYCNYQQTNWSQLLPLAEFSYNNAPHATTKISPFFANKGYHPTITVHPERDLTSALARDLSVNLDELHAELRTQIAAAQTQYQSPADRLRLPAPEFKIGENAFVKAEFFKTTRPSKKLSEKNLGPYEIIARPGTHSVTLRLPQSMRAIHPVFHVSQLEPATPNPIPNRVQSPPPPVEVDGELEFEISEILDSKYNRRRRDCQLVYLVRWSGYENTPEETDWLVADELKNAPDLVDHFHAEHPTRPGPGWHAPPR